MTVMPADTEFAIFPQPDLLPYPAPLLGLAEERPLLWGLVEDLDRAGIEWLAGWARNHGDRARARLVFGLRPGCPTWDDILARALDLTAASGGRLLFRLRARRQPHGLPANLLVLRHDRDDPGVLLTSNVGNLLVSRGSDATDAVLVDRLDAVRTHELATWFARLWRHSAPLTPETARAPRLTPAAGSPEAAAMWRDYVAALDEVARTTSGPDQFAIPSTESDGEAALPDGGERQAVHGEAPVPQPGLLAPPVDDVLLAVAAALRRGRVVAIDDHTRPPPFDMPIDPQVIGQRAHERIGSIERRQSLRLSLFEEGELRELERLRREPARILEAFTLPLRNGTRWMPETVKADFEKAVEDFRKRAIERLHRAIGAGDDNGQTERDDPVECFVNGQMSKLESDLRQFARHGPIEVPNNIAGELRKRLRTCLNRGLAPMFIYERVNIDPTERDIVSGWGTALTFLGAAAKLPRAYFAGTFRTPPGWPEPESERLRVLRAFDVLNDRVFQRYDDRKLHVRCWHDRGGHPQTPEYCVDMELLHIEQLLKENASGTVEERAREIFRIIKGQ